MLYMPNAFLIVASDYVYIVTQATLLKEKETSLKSIKTLRNIMSIKPSMKFIQFQSMHYYLFTLWRVQFSTLQLRCNFVNAKGFSNCSIWLGVYCNSSNIFKRLTLQILIGYISIVLFISLKIHDLATPSLS